VNAEELPPPRVLVADADAPTRMGLRVVLASEGLEVAGEAVDADEAVAQALEGRPDVVLIAAALPGGGIEAARRISARLPGVRLVVLSDHTNGDELLAAVRAGASGYLGRDVDQRRLPTVINAVLAGETALPRRHTEHLLEALRGRDIQRSLVAARASSPVTDREWEVLDLLAEGAATSVMARRLGISEVTVRRHVSSLLAKLELPDRASAARLAGLRSRT
jgi:DNA-binding NarL/FixJ family response regulator